jgi:uncharacterized protein (DUF433 family)
MNEPLIVSDPNIMVGKPVMRVPRITVEPILRKLAAGQTVEQILEDYPHISRAGIKVALIPPQTLPFAALRAKG